ncbi:MAG: sigma-70 family RNA polymerase sigma factor [Bacteroidia bacterium]
MHQNDVGDNDLIVSYLNGNENCLQQLILRHERKIFTSIVVLVKDKELAEDIFQETFIKIINTLRSGNYQEEGKFIHWAVRIAHNLVIDHFRKSNRMPMLRDTDDYSVVNNLKLTDENIEDKMVREQLHKEIRLLVEELPFDQREVVIMRHFADMSFKEIAETTDVSINTALGRMRYALINLRRLIKRKKISVTLE